MSIVRAGELPLVPPLPTVVVVRREEDLVDLPAVGSLAEEAVADLRALGIEQYSNIRSLLSCHLLEPCQGLPVSLLIAMGEVESSKIHARIH